MRSTKDNNNRRAATFPAPKGNWHALCFVSSGMSPLGGYFRSGRTAAVLVLLLLAALALEIWGIRASLLFFIR